MIGVKLRVNGLKAFIHSVFGGSFADQMSQPACSLSFQLQEAFVSTYDFLCNIYKINSFELPVTLHCKG